MAKNYGDTIWSLARPGLVIEDVKTETYEAKSLLSLASRLLGSETNSHELKVIRQQVNEAIDRLCLVCDLLNTIPADTGPNIQTAATKALDQPIDVDVFANDAMSEV